MGVGSRDIEMADWLQREGARLGRSFGIAESLNVFFSSMFACAFFLMFSKQHTVFLVDLFLFSCHTRMLDYWMYRHGHGCDSHGSSRSWHSSETFLLSDDILGLLSGEACQRRSEHAMLGNSPIAGMPGKPIWCDTTKCARIPSAHHAHTFQGEESFLHCSFMNVCCRRAGRYEARISFCIAAPDYNPAPFLPFSKDCNYNSPAKFSVG
ncbi:hypothetical protein QBC44DRAFT_128279 [Cladorrhinum sp. PSN332]|nr:hypothetical protein QBC44DRAFT_128279 [Cladorrhinum sp. PSN332]